MHTWVDIAQLTNTKNLNGGFVARCAAGLPFVFAKGMRIALVPPILDVPRDVTVNFAAADGVDGGEVHFAEINNPNVAELLVGCHCLLRRTELPDVSESYGLDQPDIEGWAWTDEASGLSGCVLGMDQMPGQIIIKVETEEGHNASVPLVDDFIVSIDEDASCITFDLPRGLLDL